MDWCTQIAGRDYGFNGTPLLFGGDFSVTLEADDMPDGAN